MQGLLQTAPACRRYALSKSPDRSRPTLADSTRIVDSPPATPREPCLASDYFDYQALETVFPRNLLRLVFAMIMHHFDLLQFVRSSSQAKSIPLGSHKLANVGSRKDLNTFILNRLRTLCVKISGWLPPP